MRWGFEVVVSTRENKVDSERRLEIGGGLALLITLHSALMSALILEGNCNTACILFP